MTACFDKVYVLSIGDIGYSEEELLGLSSAGRLKLAEITAFGLAVSREETDRILTPLLDKTLNRALVKQLAAERFVEASSISEPELSAHYSTNPSVELVVRHILFFSERWQPASHRDNARNKAEMALLRIEAGDVFPEIAAELSEEPGAEGRQGLLKPGRDGSWVSEFWNAAVALEVNSISSVTETQYGFHILRLEGKTEIPFEEVRPSVVLQVADLMGFRNEVPSKLTLEEAIAAGMTIPDEISNELTRDWQEQTLRWATFLGFENGLSNEEIKSLAQIALGSTGQNATIARNQLNDARDLLLNAYSIVDRLNP
jgi:virulence-associated protein VagC